jgi:hypothetical protein
VRVDEFFPLAARFLIEWPFPSTFNDFNAMFRIRPEREVKTPWSTYSTETVRTERFFKPFQDVSDVFALFTRYHHINYAIFAKIFTL